MGFCFTTGLSNCKVCAGRRDRPLPADAEMEEPGSWQPGGVCIASLWVTDAVQTYFMSTGQMVVLHGD